MRKLLILAFLFLVFGFPQAALAQISQGGQPWSFKVDKKKALNDLTFEKIPHVDVEALRAEDELIDPLQDRPWRFGENIDVSYNLTNSGVWDYLEDGSKLWRLGIKSSGALSINLQFDRYLLPQGAELFVYTPDKKQVIGAFTDFNNQDDYLFATTLLPGESVIIEYYEPKGVEFEGELSLATVTHGYRGAFDFQKAFGGSGSCNVNVVCPESEGMEDQIRSVAMLVSGGNGFCTGALVNNTENDGTPYFLSANHCYSNPGSVVFWFNWESETCDNPSSSPSYQSVSGASDISRNAESDFWLMELSSAPPEEFSPFYAGWNRTMDASITGKIWGIHHPRGDIKKISWADGGVTAASYLGDTGSGDTHWRIGPWSDGTTTEPGSSGSPLFDTEGRIIGQLHGGYAACGNTDPDWYGRIGKSWTGGGTAATRLSDWLDPFDSGTVAIEGYGPFDQTYEVDAQLHSIIVPELVYMEPQTYTPTVVIRNNGETVLTEATVSYSLNGEPEVSTEWTGSLAKGETEVVLFPETAATVGVHEFVATITAAADENPANDSKIVIFQVFDCGVAQDLPLYEDFSLGEVPPPCWTSIDADGDGHNWFISGTGHEPHTGDYAAVSASYDNDQGELTPDNWLVTPKLAIETDYTTLSFWVKGQDPDWAEEKYSVLLSTTGNSIEDFTTSLYTETLTSGDWKEVNLILEGLADEEVYIAFRHWDVTDMFQILLDNISIEAVAENQPTAAFNPTPVDGAFNQPLDGSLTWEWGVYTDTYDLWFGEVGDMQLIVEDAAADDPVYNYADLDTNTEYEWKIVSYNTVSGLSVESNIWQLRTVCGIYTPPLTETFDAEFLPFCWDNVDNIGNGQVWEFGTHTNGLSGSGNYAYLNSDAYGSGNSQNADLVTPIFDFSEYVYITLSFDHFFRSYGESAGTLYYTLDGGTSWEQVQQWTGENAGAANAPEAFEQTFFELSGQSNVMFKWKYTGNWAWWWNVDNVSITALLVSDNPEPTNHATDFVVTDVVDNMVTLGWTDAIGEQLPAGYLIKASDESYEAIVDPVDGDHEPNSTLVKHAAYGSETVTFTDLDPYTTYYFKIFAYSNAGVNINYKTDGDIPQTEGTTEAMPIVYCEDAGPSSAADSNVEFVNLDGETTSIEHTGCPGVAGTELLLDKVADLYQNYEYDLTVTFGSCGGNYSGAGTVWIDWNRNGEFEPSEVVGTWSGTPPSTQNYSITVPGDAELGNTRMRVMHREGGSLPLDPCGTFTWGSVMDFSITVSEEPIGDYTVAGTLKYNVSELPLASVTVDLLNAGGNSIRTDVTDESGNFEFTELVTGDYTVLPLINLPWSGVTAMDITAYKKHVAQILGEIIENDLIIESGDVNLSGTVDVMDLVYIRQRIVDNISEFPAGDWLYTTDPIAVVDADVVDHQIVAMVYGDALTSYTGVDKSLAAVNVTSFESVAVGEDGSFILPVKFSTPVADLASVTLFIDYDEELVNISNLTMEANASDLFYADKDGILRIVYSTINHTSYKADEALLYIKGKLNHSQANAQIVKSVTGEFGDFYDNVLPDIQLEIPSVKSVSNVSDITGEIAVYPNPTGDYVNIINAENSQIEIVSITGKVLYSQKSAESKLRVGVNDFANGTYFVRIYKDNEVFTYKFTVIK